MWLSTLYPGHLSHTLDVGSQNLFCPSGDLESTFPLETLKLKLKGSLNLTFPSGKGTGRFHTVSLNNRFSPGTFYHEG